jgi:pimeloyl-ACP methyl ester carboxylesterase
MTTTPDPTAVTEWEAAGRRITVDGRDVFVLDLPATGEENGPPVLVLHGFPSASFDYRHILDRMRRRRRVLLFDFLGFGLSGKPDLRYSIELQADVAEAVVAAAGVDRISLLTHDMGDTVGGEILARDLDGALGFSIERRALTNGSIYIDMAQLSDGQNLLLSLPDERQELVGADEGVAFRAGLAATFAADRQPDADELDAQWALMRRDQGASLLPRTIRYIEDRRDRERRFTGAIEEHPSPLGVLWGRLDPIAIHPMTERLLAARPGTELVTLDDVGHYPMIEDPERFADGVLAFLAIE